MDFQWIFLALFLVSIISGMSKTLKRSMLRNTLRLASVVLAFLVTFILQICGVFQGAVASVAEAIDLVAMLPSLASAADFIVAMASTLVSPIIFIIVFYVILAVLRIVTHFVVNAIEKKQRESKPSENTVVPEPVCANEAEEKTDAEATDAECVAISTDAEAESIEAEIQTEAAPIEEQTTEEKKPKKAKKKLFYDECGWKRAISLASGAIGGVLLLAILLMPTFYLTSIMDTVTDAALDTDADDSVVYQLVEVIDEDMAAPLSDNFVFGFYRVTGISGLMNYTVRLGGKITLADGGKTYADDVLKNLLSHSVSLAAQATSLESEQATLKEDLLAIIGDPVVSSVLSDVIMEVIAGIEVEEPAEDDILGGLIYEFADYYKNADKATVEKDIKALGGAVGTLAESGIITELVSGNLELESMLADGDTLAGVVEAISGLSAFGKTMQGAFELGVGMLGELLYIPENSIEVYDNFMADLCSAMQIDSGAKYTKFTSKNLSNMRNYINHCVTNNGGKLESSADKDFFLAYVAQWQRIQSAFSYISEDKSYGYFTIQMGNQTYVYDHKDKVIVICSEANEANYKNKISPIAGLINTLTAKSAAKTFTPEDIYGYLESYNSQSDAASSALAKKLLAKDSYVTSAATIDRMVASVDFINWDDAAKAQDSRLCANIIIKLLGLMDSLGSAGSAEGTEAIESLLDEFALLGQVLDDMNSTTCIKGLPSLVIEGLVKSDMLDDYMAPSMAYQMTDLVDKQGKTYAECMKQIVDILKFALGNLEVNK